MNRSRTHGQAGDYLSCIESRAQLNLDRKYKVPDKTVLVKSRAANRANGLY